MTRRRHGSGPQRGPSTITAQPIWRRAVALCLSLWVAVALALPGESAHAQSADMPAAAAHLHASHAHANVAQAAPAPATAEHCGDMAGHRMSMPGAPHAGHQTCLDCCCASPAVVLTVGGGRLAVAPRIVSVDECTTAAGVPHARGSFLHPFPNGPPPALHA